MDETTQEIPTIDALQHSADILAGDELIGPDGSDVRAIAHYLRAIAVAQERQAAAAEQSVYWQKELADAHGRAIFG